jgi:hypothetical protein
VTPPFHPNDSDDENHIDRSYQSTSFCSLSQQVYPHILFLTHFFRSSNISQDGDGRALSVLL